MNLCCTLNSPYAALKSFWSDGRAVIGEQPFNGHVQAVVVRNCVTQELHRAAPAFIGVCGGVGHPGVAVDRHGSELPAGAVQCAAPVASEAMAGPLDVSELLGLTAASNEPDSPLWVEPDHLPLSMRSRKAAIHPVAGALVARRQASRKN